MGRNIAAGNWNLMRRTQLAQPFPRQVLSARRHVCTRITAGPPVSLTTWTSTLHDHWPLFVVNIGIGAAVPWVIGGVHGWLVSMCSISLRSKNRRQRSTAVLTLSGCGLDACRSPSAARIALARLRYCARPAALAAGWAACSAASNHSAARPATGSAACSARGAAGRA